MYNYYSFKKLSIISMDSITASGAHPPLTVLLLTFNKGSSACLTNSSPKSSFSPVILH